MAVCSQAVSMQPEDQKRWCISNTLVPYSVNMYLHQNFDIFTTGFSIQISSFIVIFTHMFTIKEFNVQGETVRKKERVEELP